MKLWVVDFFTSCLQKCQPSDTGALTHRLKCHMTCKIQNGCQDVTKWSYNKECRQQLFSAAYRWLTANPPLIPKCFVGTAYVWLVNQCSKELVTLFTWSKLSYLLINYQKLLLLSCETFFIKTFFFLRDPIIFSYREQTY